MQTVEPQIAELLRTTIHPPSLLLRVAHIEFVKAERYQAESFANNSDNENLDGRRKNGYLGRFLLSDGELMIQALLHRRLSGLEDIGSVEQGDLIEVRRFTVNKASRLNGRGKVVFLGIEDCTFLLKPAAQGNNRENGVQQRSNGDTPSRKRARVDEPETPARPEHESFARSSLKRVRMLLPEQDDVILPSSIPSTPPLSLEDLDASLTGRDAGKSNGAEVPSPSAPRSGSLANKRLDSGPRNNDRLTRTFGARVIMSDTDDEEDDDFFESIQAIRTPAKVTRSALHDLYQSPHTGLRFSTMANQSSSNSISNSLMKTAAANYREKDVAEPQLPPHPVSKRDGTLALSQSASFYRTQKAPNRTEIPQQQQSLPAPSKSTVVQLNPTQQVPLIPPPPFYALQTLRHPPPTQSLPKNNFQVTILAVVSWLGTSLLHRAGSPFPPKRHLKIVDPSLTASRPQSRDSHAPPQGQAIAKTSAPRSSDQATVFKPQTTFQDSVTVAVYIDAADFKPAAGTIALFRGLVMQRLVNGDIILNAYGRLKEQRFANGIVEKIEQESTTAEGQRNDLSHWYITDPDKIRALGYGGKMDYYSEWWNRRQPAR